MLSKIRLGKPDERRDNPYTLASQSPGPDLSILALRTEKNQVIRKTKYHLSLIHYTVTSSGTAVLVSKKQKLMVD